MGIVEACKSVFGEYLLLQQLSQGVALSSIRLPAGGVENSLVSPLQFWVGWIAVEPFMTWRETIDNLSDADYQDLVDNAKRVGQEIRDGHYLKTALKHLS